MVCRTVLYFLLTRLINPVFDTEFCASYDRWEPWWREEKSRAPSPQSPPQSPPPPSPGIRFDVFDSCNGPVVTTVSEGTCVKLDEESYYKITEVPLEEFVDEEQLNQIREFDPDSKAYSMIFYFDKECIQHKTERECNGDSVDPRRSLFLSYKRNLPFWFDLDKFTTIETADGISFKDDRIYFTLGFDYDYSNYYDHTYTYENYGKWR